MEYQTINLEQIAPTLEAIDLVMGERSLNDRLNYVSYVIQFFPEKPRHSCRGGRGVRALARRLSLPLDILPNY